MSYAGILSRARVDRAAEQAGIGAAFTDINFDTVVVSVQTTTATGVSPITIVQPGDYLISVTVDADVQGAGGGLPGWRGRTLVNGTPDKVFNWLLAATPATPDESTGGLSYIRTLAIGDVLKVQISTGGDAGQTVDVQTASLSITRLAPGAT